MNILSSLSVDSLISDPLLMLGVFLLLVGPLFFLIALWKLIRFKNDSELVIPSDTPNPIENNIEEIKNPPELNPAESTPIENPVTVNTVNVETPVVDQVNVKAPSPDMNNTLEQQKTINTEMPKIETPSIEKQMEKTMVMPSGVADLQAQIDIMVTQIKQYNKKIIDIEESLEHLTRQISAKLEFNDLKEPPMNPKEFNQKILKLAEHVIVLEKEMAKLKTSNPTPKTPIMPI